MADLERYVRGLAGSWRGLAAGRPGAVVVDQPGLVALRHPDPVLCNAVLLDGHAVGAVLRLFSGAPAFAVWTGQDDAAATVAVRQAGLRRDATTTPMVRPEGLPLPDAVTGVEVGADPARVCRLNGVDPALLAGVPDLRCVMTADGSAGLVQQDVGDDVVLSFVATVPEARSWARQRRHGRGAPRRGWTRAARRGPAGHPGGGAAVRVPRLRARRRVAGVGGSFAVRPTGGPDQLRRAALHRLTSSPARDPSGGAHPAVGRGGDGRPAVLVRARDLIRG